MINSPNTGLCWIVLDSLESKLLLESMLNSPQADLCCIMLNSPHTVIGWIVLNSMENKPLLDYAKQYTSRPLLDCAKVWKADL